MPPAELGSLLEAAAAMQQIQSREALARATGEVEGGADALPGAQGEAQLADALRDGVAAQLASALERLESASLRADEQAARADGLAADVAALEVERAELESRLQKSTRTRAASLASLASEQPLKRETAWGDPAAPQPSEHGAESAGAAMQPEKTCVDDLEVAALTSLPHVKDAAARAWARARARALE